MKTEELKQIGLNEEQIKVVMRFNGEDITHAKEVVTNEKQKEIDGINAQLSTATESLKKFEGVEPDKLLSQITDLNTKLASQKADFDKQIADRDFNDLLNKSINNAGGKNVKAVSAMLNLEDLKKSKNQEKDIATALEEVKKNNEYLFNSTEPIKNPVAGTNNGGSGSGGVGASSAAIEAARRVMGLPVGKDNK